MGVCSDGEKDAGIKIGRTRWVSRGGIGVSATGGGKASSVMRVLVAVVERLGGGRLWLVRLQRDAVRVPGGSWKTEEVGEGLKAEHHAQERYRYLDERMSRRGAPPPGRVIRWQDSDQGAEACCGTRECGRRWGARARWGAAGCSG